MLMKIPALEKVLSIQKEAARDYKQEYRDYHGKPAQIKERAQRNAARSDLGLKRGDPREADHKNPISNGGSNSSRNIRAVSQATNRKKGAAVQKDGDWSEDKHPRAANGQFGSGSGGSSGEGKESAGAKRKRTTQARRAEGSAQTTLGTDAGRKAVQSLISGGGSALDKVSWFKPPEKKPEAAKEPPQGSAEPTHAPAINGQFGPGAGSNARSSAGPVPNPHQALLDSPLPDDHYALIDLYDQIKATDERPISGFEFPKDDPRYTKLKEIRAKIREIDNGASARNMASSQENDIMEGGREFENLSGYRSWAPPKYKPAPIPQDTPRSKQPTPKPDAPPVSPAAPSSPVTGAGKGAPASFGQIFGSDASNIKVEGEVDYTKPYILRISGKTFDHRDNLKSFGFKWGSTSKTWYKGIEPKDADSSKAELLDHIKGISGGKGALGQLKATISNGKLVPKKRTMSATEAALFGKK